jgi:hypothetical protein
MFYSEAVYGAEYAPVKIYHSTIVKLCNDFQLHRLINEVATKTPGMSQNNASTLDGIDLSER